MAVRPCAARAALRSASVSFAETNKADEGSGLWDASLTFVGVLVDKRRMA
jgi:hypothetical protein